MPQEQGWARSQPGDRNAVQVFQMHMAGTQELKPHYCLNLLSLRCALAGGWNWEWRWDSNPRPSDNGMVGIPRSIITSIPKPMPIAGMVGCCCVYQVEFYRSSRLARETQTETQPTGNGDLWRKTSPESQQEAAECMEVPGHTDWPHPSSAFFPGSSKDWMVAGKDCSSLSLLVQVLFSFSNTLKNTPGRRGLPAQPTEHLSVQKN